MRAFKKCIGTVIAAAMVLTSMPTDGLSGVVFASEPDKTVRLQPNLASSFHDTDEDGWGEFEGWGTSLCWWANRVGYSETMTEEAARLFFGEEGLNMNIGRYNIGGGDYVGEVQPVPANDKAEIYDLETEGRMPTYAGKSMKVNPVTAMQNMTYAVSDADFGITKEAPVGIFNAIGWINELGGTVGDGDNLHYTVHAEEESDYTVKLLLTLTGNNNRGVAIKVNGGAEYVADAATVNNGIIASGDNNGSHYMLFLVTFSGVALQAGENTIDIGGKGDWTPDFVKMAVIKSGEEGVLPEGSEFIHTSHIKRSDSVVPGYAVNVTRITDTHPIEWYEETFDRADAQCGYAWDYDFSADENQINVLKAAIKENGGQFIAEIFSNSPPYFMTNSGCSSGAVNADSDNLRADSYQAFAAYMADVIEYWYGQGIQFQSVSPMNEPYTNYWSANSEKQEGCHFAQGSSQSNILTALDAELQKKGLDLILAGTDETSVDTQISSYQALSQAAKSAVDRIDTHTYGGFNYNGLQELAEREGKNLWMSEVDSGNRAGTDAGEMGAPLWLAQKIATDLSGLRSSAWIFWNAIDKNIDADNAFDADSMETLNYDPVNSGYWGLAIADHNEEQIILTKKYYAFGQFSRFIRPGYSIIASGNNTLAAYDPKEEKAVIVAVNEGAADETWEFDFADFSGMSDRISAVRTSGTLSDGENWAEVTDSDSIIADTAAKKFTAKVKANSITTYTVEGVTFDEASALEEVLLNSNMVTGSTPWENSANDAKKTVDGDLTSFFDGVRNGWVQIDLGKKTAIEAIGYAPRPGSEYQGRCVNGSFYGSNDEGDDKNWTLLYTIREVPPAGVLTYAYADQFVTEENEFRYLRYSVPDDPNANCNIAEIKILTKKAPQELGMAAHYDMSGANGSLTDISGNERHAVLHNAENKDFAVYEEESVLQFDGSQWAEIPNGMVADDGSFTVQSTVSAPTVGDNWVWCFGVDRGQWGAGNIGDYIFISPNSKQGDYVGTVLGAIKVGSESSNGEKRMPVPTKSLGAGYTTITLVSDGTNLIMYMDGEEVSRLNHGFNVRSVVPQGDVLGYIGQSLYTPDQNLTANVSDIRIWSRALSKDEVEAAVPDEQEKKNMLLADIRKALLKENSSESEITTNVAFPESIDGCALTWTVPQNAAIAQDGTVTIPAGADVPVNVTVSCQGWEYTFALNVLGDNAENIMQKALEELDIPNKEDVRGNITLPAELEGADITWETDHPEIVDVQSHSVSVENYDEMPAGVVTRPAQDTEVTMTATVRVGDLTEKKTIKILVKAAVEKINEEDYTDYFFAYFTGEGTADGEQIYFASSQNGLNWKDLNDGNPVLRSSMGEQGLRDPFMIRSYEGDKFYLIATDLKIYGNNDWNAAQNSGSQSLMVWESTDLVNWSSQRMVEVSESIGAGCTWAPEAFYDTVTGEYVVFWASRTPARDEKQRVYYAKTRDFYTFTEPQVYIEKNQSSIDTTMTEYNGTYYRYTKNEGGSDNELGAHTKTIFIEKSSNVLGDFTHIASESLNASGNQGVEGPAIFKLNEDDANQDTWCLLADNYNNGGYYPLITNDLESGEFTKPDSYQMPTGARHGTPIRITAEEYQRVEEIWGGEPEEVNVAIHAGETPVFPQTVKVAVNEEVRELPVTWQTEGISFAVLPYQSVAVKGDIQGMAVQAKALVQIIPENVEYMIDCNNPQSVTLRNAASLESEMLNDTADQAKTEENTWGYVSSVGVQAENVDITAYSGSSLTNPYAGGWWAHSNCDITYQVTLPAGEHNIMMGCTGWWNTGRRMDVYYSYEGVSETKLFDLDAVASTEVYAQGTLVLEKETVVTLVVRKDGSSDPILSWISILNIPAVPEVDLSQLQSAYDRLSTLDLSGYTEESAQVLSDALTLAENVLTGTDSTQEDVQAALKALLAAEEGLKEKQKADKSQLQSLVDRAEALQAAGLLEGAEEEIKTEFDAALAAAKQTLEEADAAQNDIDNAGKRLAEAVEALNAGGNTPQKADKTELQALIKECEGLDLNGYENASREKFQKALIEAKAVNAYASATQKSVDNAVKRLQDARAALVVKEKVDISKLQALYDTVKDTDLTRYIETGKVKFRAGLIIAKAVLSDPQSQAQTDAVTADLRSAYESLKLKAEKEQVQALRAYIKTVAGLNLEDYSMEKQETILSVRQKAELALKDRNLTKEEADELLTEVEKAMKLVSDPEVGKLPFEDVVDQPECWYYEAVADVFRKGLMTGKTETIFAPMENLARAQFAVILWRMEGEPETDYDPDAFADIADHQFYTQAVLWAAENGIVTGYTGTGMFGPSDNITREQMAVMMYRYAKYKKYDTSKSQELNSFPDAGQVQPFATEAMKWCTAMEIITGDGGRLNPQDDTNRAVCAAIISRFVEKYN